MPIPLSMDELERLQRSASMLWDVLDEAGMEERIVNGAYCIFVASGDLN